MVIAAAKHHARNYEEGKNNDAALNLEDMGSSLPSLKVNKEQLLREGISVAHQWEEMKGQLPEHSFLEKIIKGMNYMCCITMVLTAVIRYIDYDPEKIFMDGFYVAFTFYLIIFGAILFAAERQYVQVL